LIPDPEKRFVLEIKSIIHKIDPPTKSPEHLYSFEIDSRVEIQHEAAPVTGDFQSEYGYVDGPAVLVHGNQDTSISWNIAICAEGYTSNNEDKIKFEKDVDNFVENFITFKPFSKFQDKLKVYRLNIVSTESSEDLFNISGSKMTFFQSYFDYTGDGRKELLKIKDQRIVRDVRNYWINDAHIVMILVNNNNHGGSGGWNGAPVFSSSYYAFKIGLHELGHSYFGLADEYDLEHYEYNRTFPNITQKTDRSEIEWKDLILDDTPIPTKRNSGCGANMVQHQVEPGTVGIYEGGNYKKCNFFRPELNCLMRTSDYVRFCAVCEREIVNKISADLHLN